MSMITSGAFIKESGKMLAALFPANNLSERRGTPLSPLDAPLCYRGGQGLESTSFGALLSMDPHELGNLWPLLGIKKYDLYRGLSACQQMIMGKNLESAAYRLADEDFGKARIATFNRFGTLIGQVPRIHGMPEMERSLVIYSHYLRFLERRGVSLALHASSLEPPTHGNAVASLRDGHGRCCELSETLCEMLSGAGIQSAIAEAWTGVKRDRMGRYMTDGLRVLGFGACHHSVVATCAGERGEVTKSMFDPAQFLKEKGAAAERWARPLQWKAWIDYYRNRGWDGPLHTFVEGGTVREDYR